MGWNRFDFDHHAQRIVLAARKRDPDSLNQAYKMRTTCAYGLERFWGEHLRLSGEKAKEADRHKAQFIADVWTAFSAEILPTAGIRIPSDVLSNSRDEATIQGVAERLWTLDGYDRQVALAVLTNLCDAVVWWTQRLKAGKGD